MTEYGWKALAAMLGLGLIVGLLIGMFLGWRVWPVEYQATDLVDLRPEFKEDYVLMTASLYMLDSDLVKARAKLLELGYPNPRQKIIELSERYILEDRDADDIVPLIALAQGMGISTDLIDEYVVNLTPTPTDVPAPTATPQAAAVQQSNITPEPTDWVVYVTATPRPVRVRAAPPPIPTATPSPTLPPREWSWNMPKGVQLMPASVTSGQTYWRLVKAVFEDVNTTHFCGGDHQIYIETIDENGARVTGQPVKMRWADGMEHAVTNGNEKVGCATHFSMYGMLGSYACQVEGVSDVVAGMGLPGKRHVSYRLVFQRVTLP